jgi:Ca2+-binding EF-hand superfamily protein
LSYVICENDDPDYEDEDEEDFDFEQLSIKCAPLVGVFYKIDARKVHQLIQGFVQGETAETWIKPKEKRQNGRLNFKALQAHYGGKRNKSVRIKEAEVLRNSLHYKNERAMSFKKFLTNIQAMFTGFEDNDELLTGAQKIRLLFQKVQSPSLTQVKNALQVSYDLDKAGEVNYDFLANSMAAEAASLPDHAHNRQASGLDRHLASGSAATRYIHWIL